MDWLNYHHLYYFWTVAREDTLSAASETLKLAPSTLSKQIRELEKSLGHEVFDRSGRRLVLNDFGKIVFRYADDIFRIGQELIDFASGRPVGGRLRLRVGVTEPVPKLVVRKLLAPVLEMDDHVHLVCREGHLPELLADLSLHQLDVVLADQPAAPDSEVKAYNHRLGQCDMIFFGEASLADSLRRDFPESLDGTAMILPTTGAVLRRRLERYFEAADIHPKIIAEFQDAAQMKTFGEVGLGVFPAPAIVADEIARQHQVVAIGEIEEIVEDFYAITVERRVQHPAVVTLLEEVPNQVF
jgi:LysR family transcriptional activator of nhaA